MVDVRTSWYQANHQKIFLWLQRSWVGASKKQRDELLDFIRHLAEDDKEGVMATKVQHNYLFNIFESVVSLLWQTLHQSGLTSQPLLMREKWEKMFAFHLLFSLFTH